MSGRSPNGAGLARRMVAGALGVAVTAPLLLGLTAAPALAAPVATSDFSYNRGGGATVTLAAPEATIDITGTAAYLTANITTDDERWFVDLAAPRGETLRPGVYLDAERAAFRTGRSPGLDVGGNGSGCNEVFGRFTVDQIESDADGNITVLDVTYSRRCESAEATPLTGRLRYRAYPLSYEFVSDEGDYVGGGQTRSYANSTTVFGLSGTVNRVGFSVSGQRDDWHGFIAPPPGQELGVGTYPDARRFTDEGGPELDVSGNGRGCNQVTGSFTIHELVADADGAVTALWLSFEQHCEGREPAMRGTFRYYA